MRAYRKKGLDSMASSMVDFLISSGVKGADILEVGGGVGAIQVELLKAGVSKTMNAELSPEYEDAALSLAKEEGVEDRITRRLGDFVELRGRVRTSRHRRDEQGCLLLPLDGEDDGRRR